MTVNQLISILSEVKDKNMEVNLSIDTGRSYRYGTEVCVSFGENEVVLCGEEPEDFCE